MEGEIGREGSYRTLMDISTSWLVGGCLLDLRMVIAWLLNFPLHVCRQWFPCGGCQPIEPRYERLNKDRLNGRNSLFEDKEHDSGSGWLNTMDSSPESDRSAFPMIR